MWVWPDPFSRVAGKGLACETNVEGGGVEVVWLQLFDCSCVCWTKYEWVLIVLMYYCLTSLVDVVFFCSQTQPMTTPIEMRNSIVTIPSRTASVALFFSWVFSSLMVGVISGGRGWKLLLAVLSSKWKCDHILSQHLLSNALLNLQQITPANSLQCSAFL